MRMTTFEYEAYLAKQRHAPQLRIRTWKKVPEVAEHIIQDAIEAHLKTLVPKCWYVRARMDVPTTVRKGVVDFNGWWNGKPFMMEVKRPGQKPTVEQSGELLWGKLAGAKTAVVYSLEEAVDFMRTL